MNSEMLAAGHHDNNHAHHSDFGREGEAKGLLSKNVRIHKRRTSIRLEKEMWEALNEVAELEGCSIHDLCGAVHDLKEPESSFTAALRVFLMEYYRSATKSGQGNGRVQKILHQREK